MKGLMILANGFEDVEGIAPIDILKRADVALDAVSFHDTNEVITSSSLPICFAKRLQDVAYEEYDFLLLPGGKAVFAYLDTSYEVAKVIDYFGTHQKLIAAICAAPSLLGKLGYLRDKEYTVFPGCGEKIIAGKLSNESVVWDGNIITARSMYYANDFALKIVEALKGKDFAKNIEKQIKGL